MMKQIIIISAFLFLLLPVTVRAADNMCNVDRKCETPEQWQEGWGDARQAENTNATPSQPEWTNATSDPQPQVIRLAGEDSSVNRSDIAAKDEQQRGWGQVNGPADDTPIPTTGSVANNDLRITGLPADVSPQVAVLNQQFVYSDGTTTGATSASDFEGRKGVWGEYGNACTTSAGTDPDLKDTSAICSGALKIYYCNPNQTKPGPTRNDSSGTSGADVWIPLPGNNAEVCNTINKALYCTLSSPASGGTSEGGGPTCTENKTETTKSTDCVSEANRTCKFVQIDVGDSAVTCYPTDYSKCGAAAALVTTSVPPLQGPTGGQPPPTTQENPPGGPAPTPITPPPPGSSFQCQQVKVFRNNVEITPADIQLGDTIVFRGFAGAVNTTVSKLRFTLTKGGVPQTPVDINTTLVGSQYQADYSVNIDTAASYSVTAAPVSP